MLEVFWKYLYFVPRESIESLVTSYGTMTLPGGLRTLQPPILLVRFRDDVWLDFGVRPGCYQGIRY